MIFLVFLYRVWKRPVAILAGAITALVLSGVAITVATMVDNQEGLGAILPGLLQGLGGAVLLMVILFLVCRAVLNRELTLPVAMAAGAMAAVLEWVYEMVAWYAGWAPLHKIGYLICLMVSGAILAGVLGWAIQKGLARTGALDRFASGREARELV